MPWVEPAPPALAFRIDAFCDAMARRRMCVGICWEESVARGVGGVVRVLVEMTDRGTRCGVLGLHFDVTGGRIVRWEGFFGVATSVGGVGFGEERHGGNFIFWLATLGLSCLPLLALGGEVML